MSHNTVDESNKTKVNWTRFPENYMGVASLTASPAKTSEPLQHSRTLTPLLFTPPSTYLNSYAETSASVKLEKDYIILVLVLVLVVK